MKLIVPDYYPRFRCIAGNCKHNCCIGWEIDIDESTLDTYQSAGGDIGHRLREHIDWNCDTPHFILGQQERCPFLNGENLCDLMVELGETALCAICDDHPRFRNEFSDRTELGIGLCCEAAATLILRADNSVQFIALEDDGNSPDIEEDEQYLFALRHNAIAIAQDRDFSVTERMEHLADFFDFPLPAPTPGYWANVYLKLERLDKNWTAALETLKSDFTPKEFPQWDTAFEQLLVYFLYRHTPAALYDGDFESKVAFAVLSTQMLLWLCAAKDSVTFDDLLEFTRMYSSEIEYSDENPEALYKTLKGTL